MSSRCSISLILEEREDGGVEKSNDGRGVMMGEEKKEERKERGR